MRFDEIINPIFRRLFAVGVNALFNKTAKVIDGSSTLELSKFLVDNNGLMADIFSSLDSEAAAEYLLICKESNIELYKDDRWKHLIDVAKQSTSSTLKIAAASHIDIESTIDTYKTVIKNSYYWNSNLESTIRAFIITDKTKYIDFIESDEFDSLAYQIRGHLYRISAKSDVITKRIARKIRSDASEKASLLGTREMITYFNQSLSEGKETNVVKHISQIYDTRHRDVAIELAKRLPKEQLVYMLGNQCEQARWLIDKRLTE